jgi:hypothetical protein
MDIRVKEFCDKVSKIPVKENYLANNNLTIQKIKKKNENLIYDTLKNTWNTFVDTTVMGPYDPNEKFRGILSNVMNQSLTENHNISLYLASSLFVKKDT